MSKPKHTPGPWTIGEATDSRAYIYHEALGSGGLVAIATAPGIRNGAEALANARLIAAAPRMLDMLRRLTAEVERFLDNAAPITRGLTSKARTILRDVEG